MDSEETICKRKERRFRTCDEDGLLCQIFIDVRDPLPGTVIDVSPGGLRLLADGRPEVGEPFVTELNTDRLHGVFAGIIRRVTPWVDGKYVLGCQLLETIPDEVLETLANEAVINRRGGDRVEWRQPAKLCWELNPEDVAVEIQDCSLGGLKFSSTEKVPENTNVRIMIEAGPNEQMVLEGLTVWQKEDEEGWTTGLAFTRREVPEAVMDVMKKAEPEPEPIAKFIEDEPILSQCILVAAAIVVFTVGILQTGLLN